MKSEWYSKPWQEVIKNFQTDKDFGLKENQVKLRQEKFGKNKLLVKKEYSSIKLFLNQFRSPLIYTLVIAGIITLFLKEFTDSIVIFGAVFLNTIVGFIQERKASKILSELKKLVKHQANVVRGGDLRVIEAAGLVPGDIIVLRRGDRVPADGRIIFAKNLQINESALTGEWLSAKKTAETLQTNISLADRDNMVYMGTLVEAGEGKAVVTSTGEETEIGKIAKMVREAQEERTPYQKKLAKFSVEIGAIIAILALLIFILGVFSGKSAVAMFTVAVAVAVAAIPEGLPIATTVVLALGMRRILRKGGLIRKLSSAETLGRASVICTDKTGTLTKGSMAVEKVITPSEIFDKRNSTQQTKLVLRIAASSSEAFIENKNQPKDKWIFRGRPTDKALLKAGIEAGVFDDFQSEKLAEIPFNSINKFVGTLYKVNKDAILYLCGAPESILRRCDLLNSQKAKLQEQIDSLAKQALRVVAVAYKKVERIKIESLRVQRDNTNSLESQAYNLIFSGLIALKDPVRTEVKEAISTCQSAGIEPVIVTGDYKLTAKAVAQELGLKVKEDNILDGRDLERLSDEELQERIGKIQIYARVEPKHKLRIVQAWQDKEKVVAMTGDGVNDAPALKQADIGVAIGSGTEVAKEAADLVLLNNSFSIIVEAVREGRAILDNIRKIITFLLSDSFTEVILIGGSMIVSWLTSRPYILPVLAAQILWVNLIEDSLPNVALAFEPEEKDIMQRKPIGYHNPLLNKEMKTIIFIVGTLTSLMLLGAFFFLLHQDYDLIHLRTIIFAMLVIDSIFCVFSYRNLRKNIWQFNPFSNRILTLVWLISVLLLLAAIYVPFLNILLKTTPLGIRAWLYIIGLGIIDLFLVELAKYHFIIKYQRKKLF